jgi:hypothetical protein
LEESLPNNEAEAKQVGFEGACLLGPNVRYCLVDLLYHAFLVGGIRQVSQQEQRSRRILHPSNAARMIASTFRVSSWSSALAPISFRMRAAAFIAISTRQVLSCTTADEILHDLHIVLLRSDVPSRATMDHSANRRSKRFIAGQGVEPLDSVCGLASEEPESAGERQQAGLEAGCVDRKT